MNPSSSLRTAAASTASATGLASSPPPLWPSSSGILEHATTPAMQQPPAADGSNVLMLFNGLLDVTIALLSIARSLVGFATLTVPSTVYAVLHYSLTLQLSFPILATLIVAGLIAVFIWFNSSMRVYEKVREPPLDSDAGFSLHPDLAAGNPADPLGLYSSTQSSSYGSSGGLAGGSGALHTYLDEFLQAIRIFGYLERPVFHDLARHLQTRRLIAGDSLSLDHDGCFYIVIDGSVGVYAPLPPSAELNNPAPALAALRRSDPAIGRNPPDDEEDEELTGYQLLHQVKNGGTLSSLFTILKLFTEGVVLPRTCPNPEAYTSQQPNNEEPNFALARGGHPSGASDVMGPSQAPSNAGFAVSPDATPIFTAVPGPSGVGGGKLGYDQEHRRDPAEFPTGTTRQYLNPSSTTGWGGSSLGLDGISTAQPSPYVLPSAVPADDSLTLLTGTVARARVDTTLAVMPAEAFRRLTKKFPNSAAHILQVILTRLSRVTMHTAHSYLGLTREVMRAEHVLNQTASAPLPASFYESGAMERLRQRFVQVNSSIVPAPHAAQNIMQGVDPRTRAAERMGTTLDPPSEKSFASPKGRPSHSPHPSRTGLTLSSLDLQGPDAALYTPALPSFDVTASASTAEAQNPSDRSHSKAPNTGELFTSTPGSGELRAQPPLLSPRMSKNASKGSPVLPHQSNHAANGPTSPSPTPSDTVGSIGWAADGQANFDLKEAVMRCIANSLGLVMPVPAPTPLSKNASYTDSPDLSTQASNGGGACGSAWGPLAMLAEVTAASRGAMGDENFLRTTSPASSRAGRTNATHGYPFPHSTLPLPFENDVEIKFFHSGEKLIASGERGVGLFYVIDGRLDVTVSSPGGLAARTKTSRTSAGGSSGPSHERAPPRGSAPRPTASTAAAEADTDGKRKSKTKPIYTVGRGGVAGYLATLLGAPSYVDVAAQTDCYVGYLPARSLDKLVDRRPTVLLSLCRRLLSLLSPTLLQIDAALDWQHVNAGQIIYRQGDEADKFYLVINGRLRAIAADQAGSSQVHIANEFGMGDSVGELEVVTGSPRTHTLHAIRDTELACIPVTLFRAVSALEPSLSIQLAQIIARRVSNALVEHNSVSHIPRPILNEENGKTLAGPKRPSTDMWRSNTNLKTVAIVPVTREVPIAAFARRLQAAFEPTTGEEAAYLNQSAVMGVLGRNAFNQMGKLKLAGWLADQEAKHRIVLYVVDTAVSSPWAQTSIRQADCVMLVGFGDDPTVGEYERLLLAIKTTARKELVLLHPERSVPPGSTRAWLRTRPWVSAHHHVEMPGIKKMPDNGVLAGSRATSASFNWAELARRAGTMTANTIPPLPPLSAVAAMAGVDDRAAVRALKRLRGRIGSRLQRYREKRADDSTTGARPAHLSDFSRLARRLCGQSVGLVLGGGGARGIAHLGVISALEEQGIPIDLIGGTSIGSFVGGLYAKEAGLVPSYGRAKKFAGRMASLWRFVLDLTYPYVSYTTGHEFNRGVFKAFRDTHIEDMWLPFFCNTTNVTWSRMEIHTTGYAWRFIRGSMTLAGLVPPLADEGDMLVDGGYMDNLPVSTMFAAGAARVFAVDVGSIDDTSPRDYGDSLSGWGLLVARWVLPWIPGMGAASRKVALIPSIPDIQARLAYVSSVQTLEEAKRTPGCFYMRMPVEHFGTLEFGSFDAIHKAGYDAAVGQLGRWNQEGKLPPSSAQGAARGVRQPAVSNRAGGIRARRNSV